MKGDQINGDSIQNNGDGDDLKKNVKRSTNCKW